MPRVFRWIGLIADEGHVGFAGPFPDKDAAVKAVLEELENGADTTTGGVFPIELEEVALPPPAPAPDPSGDAAAGADKPLETFGGAQPTA
ncbi:MAG TPA: hypothetical protein VMT50_10610 [Steroidobacteraceae bacterium]|nr:hypothetical protein [Steroidobacteraceae bacterium]